MEKDLAWGLSNEKLLKTSIEKVTGPLKHTADYHVFDYYNNTCYVELKSRNCQAKHYDTTMIGMNKINKCKEPTKDYYFFFKFDDGLFYWKYQVNDFDIKIGGRYDRGRPELNKYMYIPITELVETPLLTSLSLSQ